MHGSGGAQVVLSDSELLSLISIAINDLDWSFEGADINAITLPDDAYYRIPLSWFDEKKYNDITPELILDSLALCFNKDNDFGLFIENLSALHRRRIKYRRILSFQPVPDMDQIGPRVLLEYGECHTALLANWMVWRKWIYDIDNRSAQETGYLFEPILASCLGGEPVGARNSPVKRLDSDGQPINKGRQIDCFVPASNRTYELKLRVTIAASGQGRFSEELSFPVESQAAGFIPVLLAFYHGEEAWNHIEEEAGDVISVFIENYIKPVIQSIEDIEIPLPQSINLRWSEKTIEISDEEHNYIIARV